MNLIQQLEQEQVTKLTAGKEIPDFQPGDTVLVDAQNGELVFTRGESRETVAA